VAPLGVLVLLITAGALYQAFGSRRARRQFAPPGVFIDVGGHRLHAVCRGDGTPLVLMESAVAASSLSWSLVQPAIASFTRVCAYDRAGLAWSDVPSCPRTFDRIVGELAAVLTHVEAATPSVLVGHSFGTFVLLAYAARHPASVAGLVLIDPPTEWVTMTRQRSRLIRGGRYLSRVGALLARVGLVRVCLALLTGGAPGAPRRFVRVFGPTAARTLERLVGEVRKLPPDVHPIVQAHWCEPKCFHAMADYLRALEREGASLGALAPPPQVPIIVISSGDQPPEQMAAHQRLADRSVGGRHVLAARSGHWIQFDEPELVVAAVRELVERLRGGAGDDGETPSTKDWEDKARRPNGASVGSSVPI
jgi:pimeloyl-ACP methyl ester carboxylesterase